MAMTADDEGGVDVVAPQDGDVLVKTGRIIRKKKRYHLLCLAIRNDEQPGDISTPVFVDRSLYEKELQWCYLGAKVRIEATWHQQQWRATHLQLIQCSPEDPGGVLQCCQFISEGLLPLEVLYPSHIRHLHQVEDLLQLQPRELQRKAVARVVRELQGRDPEGEPNPRGPHTRQRFLRVLDRFEQNVPLMEILQENIGDGGDQESTQISSSSSSSDNASLPINLPDETESSRVEYLQQKKWPQIQWLLQRLHKLEGPTTFSSVLDVGGGRGDLAIAIAQEFPQVHVTMVDVNESSLQAAQTYAETLLVADRMTFLCADFAAYTQTYNSDDNINSHPKFDLVVALHACGDLSDLALQFAHRIGASFCICPCCYTKRFIPQYEPLWIQQYTSMYCQPTAVVSNNHQDSTAAVVREEFEEADSFQDTGSKTKRHIKTPYVPTLEEEITIVQRLAELAERPLISRRAMRIINSLRLQAWMKEHHHSMDLRLEEYPSAYSCKNLVMTGEHQ